MAASSVALTQGFTQMMEYIHAAFPHLLRRIKEVRIIQDPQYAGYTLHLCYSHLTSEVIYFEPIELSVYEQRPFAHIIDALGKREQARRPKHATELHHRIAKGIIGVIQ